LLFSSSQAPVITWNPAYITYMTAITETNPRKYKTIACM
jgi:hypothetical protein